MVRMAGAAHEVARNARIGLRNPDARLLLGSRHGRTDRLADQFDILDPARMNPLLDGFRDDANHVKQTLGSLLPDGYDDRRATQIDRYGIILPFHDTIFYFLQMTRSLYLMSMVRYSSQPIVDSPLR